MTAIGALVCIFIEQLFRRGNYIRDDDVPCIQLKRSSSSRRRCSVLVMYYYSLVLALTSSFRWK